MHLGGRELYQSVRDRVTQLGGPELSVADVRLILRAYADVASNWLTAANRGVGLPGIGKLVLKLLGGRRRFDGFAKAYVNDPPRLKLGVQTSAEFDRIIKSDLADFQEEP